MTAAACSDDEFIHHIETLGVRGTSNLLQVDERAVRRRRRRIEDRYAVSLNSPNKLDNQSLPFSLVPITVKGPVVIYTDAHFWPNVYTDAFWILLQILREVKPVVLIDNGDSTDGARISRHGRIGWDQRPTVKEELDASKICTTMIEEAAPEAEMYHNYGNHCLRFDSWLASRVPEMEGIHGMSLKDHFPKWHFQWGLMINGNCVVKHRYKGGAGAGRSNTLNAGVSMVTGHDHHLQITRFSDYRGTRYGVQAGTLAQINGQMFDYTEGGPTDWQAGFVVGYFDGEDHTFEAVEVKNGKAMFGGRVWTP